MPNRDYFTATDGWDGLEAQVGNHTFDGELSAWMSGLT